MGVRHGRSAADSSLDEFLGPDLVEPARRARASMRLHWMERRSYTLDCNWKVFVDNYLDGGYHVPHLHKGLDSVLDYSSYTIENGERYCLQSSPMVSEGADERTGAVRTGDRARLLLGLSELHDQLLRRRDGHEPRDPARRRPDRGDLRLLLCGRLGGGALPRNLASIAVSEQIQDEDVAICASVQRGLRSRAYTAGRLSVRREAGEHLFHRLLCRRSRGTD